MKAKKLLACALALCMILCNMPMTGAMENEGPAASISFADTANRTVLNDDQQIWEQNGITVTNDRAEATEPVKAYANPVRFYAGSTLTISYPNMGALEFDCSSDLFAVSLKNSLNIPDAQVYGDKVVALLPIIMDSYTIELYAQVRLDAVTVYTRGLPGASSAQRTDTALALGLNHIYVSDAETSNGVACTFTANAAGTYLLTSTHDTAYIRCGTELIQGNGSTTEFYLEEGVSHK